MAVKAGKKISVIPAKREQELNNKTAAKLTRVAAYCRVSTLKEEQESSYEAQVQYYTEKINQTPGWKNAGIFADDGKSGTNTKRRDDFRMMIQNAMDGKIDVILTKSVSRFARNTVDALTLIRQLKEKNVAIIFEKEGINTLEASGELLITILSSLAQEESRNISENIRWGLARKFENGDPSINCTLFMGYAKDENGELVIVPEEAEVVRLIFRLYLEGFSFNKIAKHLQEQGIKTVRGHDNWHANVIAKMLRNEKYMGDLRLQKTYTEDFITKKRKTNDGQLPQYYVEDNHEPIISKELFYQVQEELLRRSAIYKSGKKGKQNKKGKYSSKYALTGIVICGECGREYRRTTWSKKGNKKVVWRCINRLEHGTKICNNSPSIEESALQKAVMTAIRKLIPDEKEFMDIFQRNVSRVIRGRRSENNAAYENQIQKKKKQMADLILEGTDDFTSEEFEQKYQAIAGEIVKLQQKAEQNKNGDEYSKRQLASVENFLREAELDGMEYDDYLIREVVDSVRILSADKIIVKFKTGFYIESSV